MTPEQQRATLEAAAKACGIEYWVVKFSPRSAPIEKIHTTRGGETVEWNPITNSANRLGCCEVPYKDGSKTTIAGGIT